MFSEQIRNEIAAAARKAEIEPAALLAVAEVESARQAFAKVNGRDEPLIRFEGHCFHRLLEGEKRAAAVNAGLASPKAGGVPNPRTQEGRWKLLNRAAMIDRPAAWKSTSWGLGQVMGDHWERLGYKSIDALVQEARSGAGGQAQLMIRFIKANGLDQALNGHDWERFARAYNGPEYARGKYHDKMAAAYRRHAHEPALTVTGILKRGSQGDAVARLQMALRSGGFPVAADGRFGLATESALRAFQHASGLAVDGFAGPATLEKLQSAPKLERKSRFSPADPLLWMSLLCTRA